MWGLKLNGKLEPVALRTRKYVQVYAGRRLLGADEFLRAYGRNNAYEFLPFGDCKKVWRLVRRAHPDARIVRVTVSEFDVNR